MNNKELRKKIVKIISHTEIPGIKKANDLFETKTYVIETDEGRLYDLKVILTKKVAEVIADTLIENGMTFREEEDNDEFASELAEISTGSLPRTSADGFKGLIFVNNGLGDK